MAARAPPFEIWLSTRVLAVVTTASSATSRAAASMTAATVRALRAGRLELPGGECERVGPLHGAASPERGVTSTAMPPSRTMRRSARLAMERVVGGHEESASVRGPQLLEQLDDRRRRSPVEIAGRFVGEDQVRIVRKRPGHPHALALTAGELGRTVREPVTQADPRQEIGGLAPPRPGGRTARG